MMEKQTIVVKVGTSSLTLSDGTMDAEKIRNITTALKNGRRKLPINRLPLLSARAF